SLAQGAGARRDEHVVRPGDAGAQVAAGPRHELTVVGDPAVVAELLTQRGLGRRAHQAACSRRRPPSSAATRTASSRFRWSAFPVPAMSKAVPWPVEVRMNGSPTSKVTTLPKPRSF